MNHLAEPIQKEYDRWKNIVGEDDPYSGNDTVGIHSVLRAHFLIADYFYKEGEATEEEIMKIYHKANSFLEELEFKNMLSAEEDQMDCVLQINAGAGGTESCDWASMLMRMYLMYAEKNGFKVKELNFQEAL